MKMINNFKTYFTSSMRLLPVLLVAVLLSACEVDDTQEIATFKKRYSNEIGIHLTGLTQKTGEELKTNANDVNLKKSRHNNSNFNQ